jgi:hypothetical protein
MDFLTALALAQAAHTGGHFIEASRKDMPMQLDVKNFVENWGTPPPGPKFQENQVTGKPEQVPGGLSRRGEADIHGAGFAFQDLMERAVDNPNMGKANAFIKALYLAGVPNKLSKTMIEDGDIGGMERSGGKYVKPSLALSAIADYFDAPVSFQVTDGAPGLRGDFPIRDIPILEDWLNSF